MTASINASTTSGVIVTSDTSGSLALQTANTTALTISSGQIATFVNPPVMSLTSATGKLSVSNMPTGSVLQVVSATISSETATSSTSFTSTGLAASITPTSSTNKILVLVNGASFGVNGNAQGFFTVDRSGTNLGNGTAGFGRIWNLAASGIQYLFTPGILMYLDSPATTSSRTYTVQFRQTDSGQIAYISGGDGKSSIVLMEIAA